MLNTSKILNKIKEAEIKLGEKGTSVCAKDLAELHQAIISSNPTKITQTIKAILKKFAEEEKFLEKEMMGVQNYPGDVYQKVNDLGYKKILKNKLKNILKLLKEKSHG